MRTAQVDVCGCFPTGRHYPGISEFMAQWLEKVEGVFHGFDPKLPWTDFPLAVIDFETTGFDEHLDRVVEVGVVCFHRGILTEKKSWLIQPGMPIPESAMNVHGISDAMVADAPRFEEIAHELKQALVGSFASRLQRHLRPQVHARRDGAGRHLFGRLAAGDRSQDAPGSIRWSGRAS